MTSFDCVERESRADPRVYRVLGDAAALHFIYIGTLVRINPQVVSSLAGLTPAQMIALDARNYSVLISNIREAELLSTHFLLGRGIFFRFVEPTNGKHIYILHQYGDPVASAAVLIGALRSSLSLAKLDAPTRQVLLPAIARPAKMGNTLEQPTEIANPMFKQPDKPISTPAGPTWTNWKHPKAVALQALLLIAVLASVALRGCKH